jgi:hypothetical protein
MATWVDRYLSDRETEAIGATITPHCSRLKQFVKRCV